MPPKSKIMNDGTTAYLSQSGRYYIRQEPYPKWERIDYYTLRGKYIPLATAECDHCGDIIRSKHCGDFVRCSCGKTFVDTDRMMPERHRKCFGSSMINSFVGSII